MSILATLPSAQSSQQLAELYYALKVPSLFHGRGNRIESSAMIRETSRRLPISGQIGRLFSIDLLRGVALTVVLIDHVDWVSFEAGFIAEWSLKEFGFCDFADVFAYLSGFTFGWIYSEYLSRNGGWKIVRKIGTRWFQLLAGYLLTSLLVFWITVFAEYPQVSGTIFQALWLGYQPFTLMIVCMYIVVLPFLGGAIWSYRQHPVITLLISGALYAAVQLNPKINLPDSDGQWFFNPFAWQFFVTVAMAIGYEFRRAIGPNSETLRQQQSRSIILGRKGSGWFSEFVEGDFASSLFLVTSITLLAFGVFAAKGEWLFGTEQHQSMLSAIHFSQFETSLIDKTRIAPLRIAYFFALAYVVYRLLPKDDSFWAKPMFRPILACGRNSLTVYCFGVVLTHLVNLVFDWVGAAPEIIVMTACNTCLIQFLFALWIDSIRAKRKARRQASEISMW